MYLISGPAPWEKPLPVYISSPASERAQTQALSASIQSSLSFSLSQFIYLLTHYSLTTDRISHSHTHTHILNTDQYIHSPLNPQALSLLMLCLVLLNHSCKHHHHPFFCTFPCVFHHSPFLIFFFYLFLLPLSISPSYPFCRNFLLCTPAVFQALRHGPLYAWRGCMSDFFLVCFCGVLKTLSFFLPAPALSSSWLGLECPTRGKPKLPHPSSPVPSSGGGREGGRDGERKSVCGVLN